MRNFSPRCRVQRLWSESVFFFLFIICDKIDHAGHSSPGLAQGGHLQRRKMTWYLLLTYYTPLSKCLHKSLCIENVIFRMWSGIKLKILLRLCCMCAKSLQSCATICDTVGCSLPGSSVHGILQARLLEQIAMPSSRDLPDPGTEPESHASCIGRWVLYH